MRLQAVAAKDSLTPTRLYLVRHGQVADGHTHRYHGRHDIGLSPVGERQYAALAEQLKAVPLTGVYGSDLTRAFRGAQVLAQGRELTPQAAPEFREVHFGIWEGLSFAEIQERYPQELEGRFRDLEGYRIPQGESLADVRRRAMPKLRELLTKHSEEAFLVVAHAGVNRVILCEALGLPLKCIFSLDQHYGCLNIIDYFVDFTMVCLINGGVNGVHLPG